MSRIAVDEARCLEHRIDFPWGLRTIECVLVAHEMPRAKGVAHMASATRPTHLLDNPLYVILTQDINMAFEPKKEINKKSETVLSNMKFHMAAK